MSFITVMVLIFLVLFGSLITLRVKPKGDESKKRIKGQILLMFVEGEYLKAYEVADRLRERTQGRVDFSDATIYQCLDLLVLENRLGLIVDKKIIANRSNEDRKYYLVEKG